MGRNGWLESPAELKAMLPLDELLDESRCFASGHGKQGMWCVGLPHTGVIEEMKLVAPWEVNYLDPAPAIARRVSDVVADLKLAGPQSGVPEQDTVLLTSARGSASESLAAYGAMGFLRHQFVDLPV